MNYSGHKILLSRPTDRDAETIVRWENDPEHWLVSNTVAPYSLDQILHFIDEENDLYENQQMRLMIRLKTDKAVGCIDLYEFDPKNRRVGIGILVDQAFRGNGYGHEAIDAVVAYCLKELEMHCVYAEVHASNQSSMRLFEACGFERVGVKSDWFWDGQGFVDQHLFQIVSEE